MESIALHTSFSHRLAQTHILHADMVGAIPTMNKGQTVGFLFLLGVLMLLVVTQMVSSVQTHGGAFGEGGATDSSPTEADFCNGMAMVMAMGGFQWSLVGKQAGDCLNYFAPRWTLNTAGKFQGAMLYSFLIGILTEGVHTFEAFLRPLTPPKLRHTVLALLYGFQRFFGYIVMLIAMTYSFELLLSAICGLMVGHLLFPNSTRREWKNEARRQSLLASQTSRHPTLATPGLDDSLSDHLHRAVLLEEEEPLLEARGDTTTTTTNDEPNSNNSSLPLRRRKQ